MNTEISKLVIIGINHKTSTVAERELYQINKKEIKVALNFFSALNEVEAAVIVSTCSRLEFYLVIKPGVEPFTIINDFYFQKRKFDAPINENLFYSHKGVNAVQHLFEVSAGLDSMLIGEFQILGQLKDAYSIACSEKTAGQVLHKLFHNAFRVSKLVRTKTGIGSNNQSLSGIAFKIIKEKLKKEDVITIIGVNQNTKIIAENLNKAGFSHLLFVNRTLHKAEELADKYKGIAFSLDYIEEPLITSKCIFSCTGAPGIILNSELINGIYLKNKLPELIIDMAVPRDINIKGLIKDIEVINLEDLKKYLRAEEEEIVSDITEAERIISNEIQIFCKSYGFPEAKDECRDDESLCYFQEEIELVRLQLLEEIKMQISDDGISLLNKFSRSLVHRMKSIITQALKTSSVNAELNKGS
jgi:glutamyl-tRNA reductase